VTITHFIKFSETNLLETIY